MSPDRWEHIQEFYHAALELEPTQRSAFLEEACGDDEALCREVEALLAEHGKAGSFLETPALDLAAQVRAGQGSASVIGRQIGPYQILSLLGVGGMGEVYLAQDTRLERSLALKVLPTEWSSDQDRMRRFVREARAASALKHPNVAHIYEIGEWNGIQFIAMEYVEGQTLAAKISNHPLNLTEVVEIGIQVADALDEAHSKGITHRDIKPANLMLTARGQVKVLDFGLAKVTWAKGLAATSDLSTVVNTDSGVVMGTRNYMSPEQALGKTVDHRTDIYSLGVVLCEMATGHLPESDKGPMEITARITDAQAKVTDGFNKAVVTELGRIVQKCLAMDQQQRYQSAQDLLADLKELKQARDTGATLTVAQAKHHIVGREKELAVIQTGLQQVFAGPGLLLCVAGEPGIGKTTVVEQFLDKVATGSRPCLTAKGQCSERLAGTDAYLPFLEVLESLLHKEADVSVARLMRETAPWWYVQVASLSPDDSANAGILAEVKHASQERVKRELSAFLREVSSKRPLVLFFEDLHWADVSSIDMLAYLAAKFDAMRVLIVTTYRPDELQLTKHPFLQIKPNLLSRGQCREIALGFLPHNEIKRYLELEFPEHAFPAAFAKLIHDKTEGSPLFMVDLLRDLQDRDVIVEEEGRWQLAQSVEDIRLELPDSVKGMIEHKIQQLGENEHWLLLAASVQGFQFDSAVVTRVLETDEEEVEQRLRALESHHRIVQLVEEGEFPDSTLTLRYRFVHVLYQNELYSSLTGTRRVRLSRAAAQTLEGFYGDKSGKVAAELASLYKTARDYEKAIHYLNQAAANAAGVFAFQEAITLAQRGLELVEILPLSAERDLQELSLQANLGASIVAIKGYGDIGVGKAFTRARELSDKLGTDKLSDSVAYGLILYFNVTVQLYKTLELCHELLEQNRQTTDYARSGLSHSGMGIAEELLGNFASSSTQLERAIQLHKAQVDHLVGSPVAWDCVVYGLDHLAWNVWILGFPDKALKPSTQARVEAERSHNPFNMTHYYGFAGFLYQCRGDAKKVVDLSDVKYAVSKENGYQLNMAWANMQKGWAIVDQGKPEKGLQMLLEGLAIWRAVGMVVFVPYYHALIAEIYGKLNRSKEGLALLEESFDIVNKTDHRMWEAELHRIKGELLYLQGEAESKVGACYKKALEIARTQEARSFELRAAMSLSRLWQHQGKHKQAKKLIKEIYGWFTEGFETRDLCEAKQLLAELSSKRA